MASVSIDPSYGIGHANLAVLYTVLKQPEKAVRHLNRAIQLGIKGPVIDKLSLQYR
jgi:Tfp pilus assembly protein PilF